MTMPAPSVTPTTNVATAINGNDDVAADHDQRHGAEPPHRPSSPSGSAAAAAPTRPPAHRARCRSPKNARMKPYIWAPSSNRSCGDERQQHLDRAEHHEHEHAGEQQRPQQPRRAHHEAQPSRRSRSTCGRSPSSSGAGSLTGRVATSRTRPIGEQRRHRDRTQRRGTSRPPACLRRPVRRPAGTPGARHPRRRWRPAAARRAGSAAGGAVGGEEERRSDAQRRGRHGHVPDPQCAKQSQHGDRRHGDDVDRLDGDDDGALVDAIGGDPADQDERDQADAEARRHQRQRRRDRCRAR